MTADSCLVGWEELGIESRYQVDRRYMERALLLAQQARDRNEIPVGAVVVLADEVVGQGANQSVSEHDPSGHAEIVAIRDAARRVGNYRLNGATLYVTLEPCIMCAGAILHARLERVVFAAWDARYGAAGSRLNLLESPFLNHRCQVESGVLDQRAKVLLHTFFAQKRLNKD